MTIKSIKIDKKNKKVFVTKRAGTEHYECFDKFFNLQNALEKIQKQILIYFFEGYFYGLSTNYGKAVESFSQDFDERERYEIVRKLQLLELRNDNDNEFKKNFEDRLFKHFQDFEQKRKEKKRFVLRTGNFYIKTLGKKSARTINNINRAKRVNTQLAEMIMKKFNNCAFELVQI